MKKTLICVCLGLFLLLSNGIVSCQELVLYKNIAQGTVILTRHHQADGADISEVIVSKNFTIKPSKPSDIDVAISMTNATIYSTLIPNESSANTNKTVKQQVYSTPNLELVLSKKTKIIYRSQIFELSQYEAIETNSPHLKLLSQP